MTAGMERPKRWVKPAMRKATPEEVAACQSCDENGNVPVTGRATRNQGGNCWFGCETPIVPVPDPMWCANPIFGDEA